MSRSDLRQPLRAVLAGVCDLPTADAKEVLWLAIEAVDPTPRGPPPTAPAPSKPISPPPAPPPEPPEPAETRPGINMFQRVVLEALHGAAKPVAASDVRSVTGMPSWRVKETLRDLEEANLLERSGKARWTRYAINAAGKAALGGAA